MTSRLESENSALRQQLEALMNEAQCNEDKMRRFDQLERRLIGAGSLVDLIGLLLSEYKQAFAVDSVTLALLDQDFEVTRLLESGLGSEAGFDGLFLFQSPAMLEKLYGGRRHPCLCRFDVSQHRAFFSAPLGELASVALLPLSRQGELIGSLNFGSARPERYTSNYGTDFLERLAEVVAICLESALSKERLKQIGLTDPLTGVSNRRFFEHRCLVEVSQSCRYEHPLACLLLDIDWFKRINDTYGHPTGDAVLRGVANDIQSQLRLGDTIARYGGEEFVVLLPRSGPQHAGQIAERIRASIEEKSYQTNDGQVINVTISIGFSMLPVDALSADLPALSARMIAAADKALYQAKHRGRNRVLGDDNVLAEGAGQPSITEGASPPFVSPLLKRLRRAFSAFR